MAQSYDLQWCEEERRFHCIPDDEFIVPDTTACVNVGVHYSALETARNRAGQWQPKSTGIELHGYHIGGMVYFGSGLRPVHGHGIEPALIDPGLRVTKPVPSYRGHDLPRVPNYTHISPPARGRYLQWLADGRKDPEIAIGFVFLFFCGLERRLLADDCPLEEQAELIAEIERLRAVYAQNSDFETYSFRLLDYVRAKDLHRFCVDVAEYPAPPVRRTCDQPYSATLRLGLGYCALDSVGVPAAWALTWAESHPGYRRRTAAERCRSEFEELFDIEYAKRCPSRILKNSQ